MRLRTVNSLDKTSSFKSIQASLYNPDHGQWISLVRVMWSTKFWTFDSSWERWSPWRTDPDRDLTLIEALLCSESNQVPWVRFWLTTTSSPTDSFPSVVPSVCSKLFFPRVWLHITSYNASKLIPCRTDISCLDSSSSAVNIGNNPILMTILFHL